MKTYSEKQFWDAIEMADGLAYCAALNFEITGSGLTKEQRFNKIKEFISDKHLHIIENLIKEFDNPDNHGHQRDAIREAKEYLEIRKS